MKLISVCALLTIVIAFSSCTKWYDCECTRVQTKDSVIVSEEIILYPTKDKKESAEEFCDVYNTSDSVGVSLYTRTCSLKKRK